MDKSDIMLIIAKAVKVVVLSLTGGISLYFIALNELEWSHQSSIWAAALFFCIAGIWS